MDSQKRTHVLGVLVGTWPMWSRLRAGHVSVLRLREHVIVGRLVLPREGLWLSLSAMLIMRGSCHASSTGSWSKRMVGMHVLMDPFCSMPRVC